MLTPMTHALYLHRWQYITPGNSCQPLHPSQKKTCIVKPCQALPTCTPRRQGTVGTTGQQRSKTVMRCCSSLQLPAGSLLATHASMGTCRRCDTHSSTQDNSWEAAVSSTKTVQGRQMSNHFYYYMVTSGGVCAMQTPQELLDIVASPEGVHVS